MVDQKRRYWRIVVVCCAAMIFFVVGWIWSSYSRANRLLFETQVANQAIANYIHNDTLDKAKLLQFLKESKYWIREEETEDVSVIEARKSVMSLPFLVERVVVEIQYQPKSNNVLCRHVYTETKIVPF